VEFMPSAAARLCIMTSSRYGVCRGEVQEQGVIRAWHTEYLSLRTLDGVVAVGL
jgi:hypothetical protein